MDVKVLGTGCPKCNQLAANAKQAIKELGLDVEIEKVTQINDIMSYGVMMTPALVVNGEVKAVGKIPSTDEIKTLLNS